MHPSGRLILTLIVSYVGDLQSFVPVALTGYWIHQLTLLASILAELTTDLVLVVLGDESLPALEFSYLHT